MLKLCGIGSVGINSVFTSEYGSLQRGKDPVSVAKVASVSINELVNAFTHNGIREWDCRRPNLGVGLQPSWVVSGPCPNRLVQSGVRANYRSIRGQSVGCHADNAKGERVQNIGHATILFSPSLSGRRRSAVAAARSHRKSPEKPMCSHVSGDVWASSSSGTGLPWSRRCWKASAR